MGNKISIGCAYKDQDIDGGTLSNIAALSVLGTTSIGDAAADLVTFHGATASGGAQAAFVAQISTSAGVTGAVGFTASQAGLILSGINSLLTMAINKGFMASS